MEVIRPNNDLRKMPLSEMSFETLEELIRSFRFTVMKIVETTTLTADTQGFIDFLGFRSEGFYNHPLPFAALIDHWHNSPDHLHAPSVGMLIEILHIFERYDILYNITDLVEKDLKCWKEKQDRMEKIENEANSNFEEAAPEPIRPKRMPGSKCPEPADEFYDAIFSFNEDDEISEYKMEELYTNLKRMYGLRLCKKIDTPHLQRDEMMRKIAKRCNHVIVLLSKSYLESEKCYADLYHMCVTDPMAYQRKIIPVMIENMSPPPILMDRVTVKYYRTDKKRENLQSIFRAIKPNHIVRATQR